MIVYFATGNEGKLREIAELLGETVELRPPPGDFRVAEESGTSYAENARIKARALARHTRCAALGDDSGLEVDALGGRPGIHSARYAENDAARIDRLLAELAGVARGRRAARFRCALVLVRPGGGELVIEGSCEGRIAAAPRGSAGFGYDPVFLIPEVGKTFAEMTSAEKAALSHRGRAARRLAELLAGTSPS